MFSSFLYGGTEGGERGGGYNSKRRCDEVSKAGGYMEGSSV